MRTLVYVGTNVGNSLWNIIQDYDVVYAFEPDPEMFIVIGRLNHEF